MCSNIPALKEVTKNATGGLMFEGGNPKDLSQKILCLLEDKGLYNKCVEEGTRLVQRYNWESIAKKTERVYEWAIKQRYRLKS